MVAKTIGTHVSFAWLLKGADPTTGSYKRWCDCTAHPDFNPEADQIETTTLCAEHNHTYEDGLVDFGTLEFSSNMTNDTYDLFLGDEGFATLYEEKASAGYVLWVCTDIKGFAKSYYVPVKPQPFGLPAGESGSNKYDLIVRFSVTGDGGWYNDPTYQDDVNYVLTATGYSLNGVRLDVLKGANIVRTVFTNGTSTAITLPAGKYIVVASLADNDSQVKDADISVGAATVTFTAFTE